MVIVFNGGDYTNSSPSYWQNVLITTAFTASMAVNTLVTGMIVFRILKDTGVRHTTSVERTLGSTGGNKFRHIVFIVIESGMALLAIKVVRIVLGFIQAPVEQELFLDAAHNISIVIDQMLNVIIIRSFILYLF